MYYLSFIRLVEPLGRLSPRPGVAHATKEASMAKAAQVSRRSVLKGAAGAVLSTPLILTSRKSSAQGKRIVIRDPGGPFTVAFAEAFYKPFREASGIEAVGVASA